MFRSWFRRRGSSYVLRRLLRQQEAQTRALEDLAATVRWLSRGRPVAGFLTGEPDGKDQSAVSYTRDSDIVELMAIEQELRLQFGREPTNDEVVREWEARG